MNKVFAKEPLFILKKKHTWYLRGKRSARKVLQKELAAHYKPVAEIGGRQIYKRRSAD